LLKKIIIIIGIVTVYAIIMTSLVIFASSKEKISEEPEVVITGDVIMSTKSSRPGCDETDRCYIPSVFDINSGNQVTWVNEDSAFHSVTSGFYGEPSDLFDSGHLDPYESFTFNFDEKGTYDYFCTLHPWMKGQVLVG
jgi:plastocyanin